LPFSQPQPSPSGSAKADVQFGFDELLGAGVVLLEPTRQDLPFSQPKPSPSGSDDALWQVANVPDDGCVVLGWLPMMQIGS